MKKHIRIKAASCLDMIHAFNSKIQELDPGYVSSAENINASDDGFYSDAEMESIDRNGSDEDVAIAAISYNRGVSVSEARKIYETIDDAKLQEYIDYYFDRDLPVAERQARAAARRNKVGAACNRGEKSEVTAEEYIQGAEDEVDEAYVDEMMQYVADETVVSNNAVCSWRVEGDMLIFVLAGLDTDFVDEYSCPLTDLTGDIDTDMNYVLSAINGDGISEEEIV